jgi:hypothetical protein
VGRYISSIQRVVRPGIFNQVCDLKHAEIIRSLRGLCSFSDFWTKG